MKTDNEAVKQTCDVIMFFFYGHLMVSARRRLNEPADNHFCETLS